MIRPMIWVFGFLWVLLRQLLAAWGYKIFFSQQGIFLSQICRDLQSPSGNGMIQQCPVEQGDGQGIEEAVAGEGHPFQCQWDHRSGRDG